MTRRPYFTSALAWLAGILILASGCMDQSPTATLLDPATVSGEQAQLPGNARPILAAAPFEAGTRSAQITPAGGSIDFGIGSIVFPRGAVDRATVVTAKVDGETMSVEFDQHLVFGSVQPILCFNADAASLPEGFEVVHVKDDGSQSIIGHEVTASAVCVRPPSFSKFILAAE